MANIKRNPIPTAPDAFVTSEKRMEVIDPNTGDVMFASLDQLVGAGDFAPLPTGSPTVGQQVIVLDDVPLTLGYADRSPTINPQTGTTYTFVIGDQDNVVTASNAAAQTYTVPPNSSVAFPVGSEIELHSIGVGVVTVAQGAGVTINPETGSSLILSGTGAVVSLQKVATDTWSLVGNLAQKTNAQTGTTYTIAASDVGGKITLSNASAITLTVPQDSDVQVAVGSYIDLAQIGAGQVTVAAGTGATLRVSGLTAKARAQYARFGVEKVLANTWTVFGDLAAS